ncbi:nucleotidyltransferase family protein [Longimicrobium sp.]|uniref:nucleotidyltransferase domain-containing protein n=1 Tax=Longimicrobium sp. TaxID=2029185 RepID=UPI002E34CB3B|nr:nucleotidyltransferase family protein [Longimicrobium sp.]HEX6038770.1 nucleotidyltransferase family protein [Longimicrobium sp.]
MTDRPHDAALPHLALLLRGAADGLRAAGGPDWAMCATLALRHGLGPLLYHCGPRIAEEWPMPPEVERELRTSYMGATLENRAWLAEAGRAIGRMAAAGVPVAALKGLHLAAAVYDEPALRKLGDVDLLVPAEQLQAARAALIDDGYTPDGPDDPTIHHVAPMSKPRAAPIELHWELCPESNPFRMDVAPLWERMVPITVAGQPALGLSPEDLLLHLCVHGTFNHRWVLPLRNVFDIVMVVERNAADLRWDLLVETAHATRTERAVFCGLALARETFGVEVPGGLLDRLVPAREGAAAVRIARENVLGHESAGPEWMDAAVGQPTLTGRMRGLLGRVFAPPERLLETSGRRVGLGRLAWVYLTRPAVLLLRHRGRIAGLLKGGPAERAQLRAARSSAALGAWVTSRDT